MAIHFENYKTYSKGQGFIGVACRTKSPQASTKRLFACDCFECKRKALAGKLIISRTGETGRIVEVFADRVELQLHERPLRYILMSELDTDWAPLDLGAIFGMEAKAGE